MEFINFTNEIIIKNEKNTLFFYGFIFIIIISILQNNEYLYKNIYIFLIGLYIIFYIQTKNSNKSEAKILSEKKNIPKIKNCKKINKKIIRELDNERELKNILLNLNFFKKFNNSAIKNIIKNVGKFSKINKLADELNLDTNIEKLKTLRNIIINDIHSIVYSLPSVQGYEIKSIYLEPLNDKLIFCMNQFILYSNNIISKKISINNLNFKLNKNISSKYLENIFFPQAHNEQQSII